MNNPIRPSDWIGELCIALAHRWEPERLFVIFTAYVDESDTHGVSPTIILGAFLGHAYQWRIFNRDLDRLRKQYGFNIFHAKDFKAQTGEFRGWNDEKCSNLIYDLTSLVRDDLTEGATIWLERDRYLREYRNTVFPPKMQPDSQFGVCFRGLLAHLIRYVASTGKKPVLHIVVEKGHPNIGAVDVIFDQFKARLLRHNVDLLGTITRAEKTESKELMVADFLAHSHSLMRASADTGGIDYKKIAPPPPKKEASLTFLEFTAQGFADMKAQYESDKREKMDEWRRQRDARRLASSSPKNQQPS
jgi:hypothetical protein